MPFFQEYFCQYKRILELIMKYKQWQRHDTDYKQPTKKFRMYKSKRKCKCWDLREARTTVNDTVTEMKCDKNKVGFMCET